MSHEPRRWSRQPFPAVPCARRLRRSVAKAHVARLRVDQDMQATTPMDPRALDAMMEYQLERYGNPHSRTHMYGWDSEAVVERAREQVANLIGASPKEVRKAVRLARACHVFSRRRTPHPTRTGDLGVARCTEPGVRYKLA